MPKTKFRTCIACGVSFTEDYVCDTCWQDYVQWSDQMEAREPRWQMEEEEGEDCLSPLEEIHLENHGK